MPEEPEPVVEPEEIKESSESSRPVTPKPPPVETVERGVSPRPLSAKDQCPQVSEGAFSIEEVDVEEVQKEVREAACDPIEFAPAFEQQVAETQTRHHVSTNMQTQTTPEPPKEPEPAPVEELPEPEPQETPKKTPPPPPDTDWARSKLFKLVKELVNLPPKNRLARAKELERDFCNP